MKRLVLMLLFGIAGTTAVLSQTLDEYWEFTNLYATDDTSEVTHLFYAQMKTRIHNCYDGYDYDIVEDRSIIHRHHNTSTNIDSIFIPTHNYVVIPGCYGGGGVSIADFHPFDGNPENVLFYGGYSDGHEPYAYLQVGDSPFTISPLFGYFEEVIANPYLGNDIFIPFSDFTIRIPFTKNPDTINVINNSWYNWLDYREIDADPPDSLNGYFKNFEFHLIDLSRFTDSLAFYQKDGVIMRSENLGRTGDTLGVTLSTYSDFHYDADSLHIYVTHTGSNSILVSDNYGKKNSWHTITLPSYNKHFSLDRQSSGLIYFADSTNIYRSKDYGSSFELLHQFDKTITGIYKKPGKDVLFVLLTDNLIQIDSLGTKTIRKVPTKKTVHIKPTDFPYNLGDKLIYRIYEREQESDDSYSFSPIEDYEAQLTEITQSLLPKRKLLFEFSNSTARPLFSKFYFDQDSNMIVSPWKNYSKGIFMKNNQLQYEHWLTTAEEDSIPHLGIFRRIRRSMHFGVYDTVTRINFFLPDDSVSSRYRNTYGINIANVDWSNKFGITTATFYRDSLRYVLKGAVIDDVVYGDTTTTLIVSNEPEPAEIPNQVSLKQNYPNPFNPSTVISYQLAGNSLVRLEVFDVTGRKVAILVNDERKTAGTHLATFNANDLASGVYFYRLETGGKTLTRKMLLVK